METNVVAVPYAVAMETHKKNWCACGFTPSTHYFDMPYVTFLLKPTCLEKDWRLCTTCCDCGSTKTTKVIYETNSAVGDGWTEKTGYA